VNAAVPASGVVCSMWICCSRTGCAGGSCGQSASPWAFIILKVLTMSVRVIPIICYYRFRVKDTQQH
jgi:hypothetical protein